MSKKILVGLSGGVDSAVTAYLLKQEGYDVTAGFMINYLAPEGEHCPTEEDIEVAKEVAQYLEIPFFTFDYRDEYEDKVLNYMYEGYKKGITPNPDIMCNSEIKFKVFLDEALELGFDMVATGHYARIELTSPPAPLLQGEGSSNVVGNYGSTPDYVKDLMKDLRRSQTKAEELLWEILRNRKFHNMKFRRQHPFGRYIADFYCDEFKLVIELDGKIHENQKEYDAIRDGIISKYGVKIIRIPNEDVFQDIDHVLQKVIPSPGRRGLGGNVVGGECNQGNVVGGEGAYYALKKGLDPIKDQSYFLAGLDQSQLSKALFPIGNMQKSEVRELAKKIGLPNADRKDSQGICFVGKVRLDKFLQKKIPAKPGNIIDTSGKILGTHKGIYYYTVGQRKGLDIGGMPEPIFVVRKDILKNELIVGYEKDEGLYANELIVSDMHFLGKDDFGFPLKAKVKIRYRQADQDATIEKVSEGYRVVFNDSQRAIASGQIVAVYLEDELVMSGVIS